MTDKIDKSLVTVLVVDDDKGVGDFFRRLLQHAGYGEVILADHIEHALHLCKEVRFTVLVTDLRMREGKFSMDGHEFLHALAEAKILPESVIMATGTPEAIEKVNLRELPVWYTIAKPPPSPTTLTSAVEEMLRRVAIERAQQQQ